MGAKKAWVIVSMQGGHTLYKTKEEAIKQAKDRAYKTPGIVLHVMESIMQVEGQVIVGDTKL